MKIYVSFFLVLIILVFTGCSKYSMPNNEQKLIVGTWKFTFSSGGFTGGGDSSFAKDTKLVFDKSGFYKLYQDGSLKTKGLYSLSMKKSITGGERPRIRFLTGKMPFMDCTILFSEQNESLYLFEEVYDGFGYSFEREE